MPGMVAYQRVSPIRGEAEQGPLSRHHLRSAEVQAARASVPGTRLAVATTAVAGRPHAVLGADQAQRVRPATVVGRLHNGPPLAVNRAFNGDGTGCSTQGERPGSQGDGPS